MTKTEVTAKSPACGEARPDALGRRPKRGEATAEIFWTAFSALSQRERQQVVERFLKDRAFREDLMDIALIESRRSEPSRSLDEYLSEPTEKRVRRLI